MKNHKIALSLLVVAGAGILWLATRKHEESITDIRGGEAAPGLNVDGSPAEVPKGDAVQAPVASNGKVASGDTSAAIGGGVGGALAQESAVTPQAPSEPRVCESRVLKSREESTARFARNELSLASAKLPSGAEASTFCLRVDGTPVKYELDGKAKLLKFGRIAKRGEVTLSYCVGRKSCAIECKVPRDEFMEALMGQGLSADDDSSAGWESAGVASKEEQELDRELAAMSGALDGPKAKGANASWTVANDGTDCAKDAKGETVARNASH